MEYHYHHRRVGRLQKDFYQIHNCRSETFNQFEPRLMYQIYELFHAIIHCTNGSEKDQRISRIKVESTHFDVSEVVFPLLSKVHAWSAAILVNIGLIVRNSYSWLRYFTVRSLKKMLPEPISDILLSQYLEAAWLVAAYVVHTHVYYIHLLHTVFQCIGSSKKSGWLSTINLFIRFNFW